jgi:hypothetical protein
MKRINVLLLATVLLAFIACSKNVNPNNPDDFALAQFTTFKSYIEIFVRCQVMEIQSVVGVQIDETKKIFGSFIDRWATGDTNPDIFSVADGIGLDISGHRWSNFDEKDTCVFYDNKYYQSNYINEDERIYYAERKAGYDYYIALIGDTSYNARLREDESSLARAIITPLKSIAIVADRDFNSDYPAGSDLSPLFTVYFDDPYSTIKNGYKQVEGTYSYTEGLPYPQSIFKAKLSEANFEERPFISDKWHCLLNVAPEKTDTYTFQVKAAFVDGTALESQSPPINIKGAND